MKKLIFLMACICLFTVCQAQSGSPLKDGLYLVARVIKDSSGLKTISGTESTVFFNRDFLEDAPKGAIALSVYTQSFVPLELAEEPQLIREKNKNSRLQLSFSRLASEKLEAFTANNIMKQATMIVNGKALTVNKIRAAITGGKMEVSRCSDNACEHIYIQLKDNVVK